MDLCKDTKDRVSEWWSIVVAMPVHMRLLGAVFLVLLALFLCVVFSENPKWVFTLLGISKGTANGISQKYEALKFLGIGMGGILLVVQALASYKRAKAMEDTAKEQANAVLKTEQGQRQERLKNAIEHLGHESSVSVRLGGAYELFHLAQDTEELCQTVLDVLCAHIRQTTGEDGYREKHKSDPSEEIQSLLTLLFVEEHEVFKGLHVNLQGGWLNGANLQRAHLEKANLARTHLQKANLWRARLQGANLMEAQLRGSLLDGAHLQAAILIGTHLQKADLSNVRLQGAFLIRTQLQVAFLRNAQLDGSVLSEAYLQGVVLLGAQLKGVQKANVGKDGVSLKFAETIRASIGKESDLSGAIFEGGLSQEDVDSLVQGLSDEKTRELRTILEQQIGQPPSHELPEDSGAVPGSYTKEEAEQWIAEYKQAMSKVPGAGDS